MLFTCAPSLLDVFLFDSSKKDNADAIKLVEDLLLLLLMFGLSFKFEHVLNELASVKLLLLFRFGLVEELIEFKLLVC